MACLIYRHQGRKRRLSLGREVCLIGRDEASSVVLDVDNCSRKHSRITYDQGKYWLEDLASRNGTYQNGRLLRGRQPLRNRDVIGVAGVEFSFRQRMGVGALFGSLIRRKLAQRLLLLLALAALLALLVWLLLKAFRQVKEPEENSGRLHAVDFCCEAGFPSGRVICVDDTLAGGLVQQPGRAPQFGPGGFSVATVNGLQGFLQLRTNGGFDALVALAPSLVLANTFLR